MEEKTQTAYLAGGCFWCLEAVYARVRGVASVIPGYAGGRVENPSYEEVSGGETGYAETVKVDFDPSVISYEDLLSIFFYVHDPTTLNRQGSDVGTQYRSAIFAVDAAQQEKAVAYVEGLKKENVYKSPIVTEISLLDKFWPAEEYHRKYFERNPEKAYCQLVIAPKVEKLKAAYKKFLIEE